MENNSNSIPNEKVGKIIEIWAKNNKIKYINDRYDYKDRYKEKLSFYLSFIFL